MQNITRVCLLPTLSFTADSHRKREREREGEREMMGIERHRVLRFLFDRRTGVATIQKKEEGKIESSYISSTHNFTRHSRLIVERSMNIKWDHWKMGRKMLCRSNL